MNATPPEVTVVRLPQSRVQCDVTFDSETTAVAETRALEHFGSSVKVDGFRPGKIPTDILKQKVNADQLMERIIRELLRAHMPSVTQRCGITPLIPPHVELIEKMPLKLRIVFVEKPMATIQGLEKIHIERKAVAVDDKDIDRILESMRDQFRTTKEVDRPAKNSDQVTIDFWAEDEAKERIPELATARYRVILGSNTLLPGMENALVNCTKGQTVQASITIPMKHQLERLRGKAVMFSMTVTAVEEVNRPEITESFVKEKFQSGSVDELRKSVRSTLEKEEEKAEHMRRERLLLEEIRKSTKVDLAPELIEAEERVMVEDMRARLEQEGKSFSDWIKESGKANDEIAKEIKEQAKQRLTLRFGLEKMIELKNVSVSDEEMEKAVQEELQRFADEDREDTAKLLVKGRDEYVQLKWQKLVEKTLGASLA